MKTLFVLVAILIITDLGIAQIFQVPESASFDAKSNRYFVSNYGDGNIIQIDSTGTKTIFKTGLSKSLGMVIQNNTLFAVTNLTMVKGFNLEDKRTTFEIQINEAKFLNDITSDNSGFLYVTDSRANSVFKIDVLNKEYSKLITTELDNPNGIIFDKSNNRLILCYFRANSRIDEINLNNSTISTLTSPGLDNLDGIALDDSGNFFISSWGAGSFSTGFSQDGSIFKFDSEFKNEPTLVSTGHRGPADIFYAIDKQVLVIPLFLKNEVEFKRIK